MGQDDRPPDHLVGLLGIDPQPQGDVHGLVELGVVAFLEQADGILERVLGLVLELPRLQVFLSSFSH